MVPILKPRRETGQGRRFWLSLPGGLRLFPSKPQSGRRASWVRRCPRPATPLPSQYPPRGPARRAAGLAGLRVKRAEGAASVGGAQGRGGRAVHGEGTEVLGGEGDHVGRLAQQQEEQEVRDKRLGVGVLLQISGVAETQLLLAGPSPSLSRPRVSRAPGSPLTSFQGGLRDAGTSQPTGVCTATRYQERLVTVEFMSLEGGVGGGWGGIGTAGGSLSSPSGPGTSSRAPCPPPTSGASS